MAISLNQYNNNGEAFWRGGEERIWHDVDAQGKCLVPWCTYTSDGETEGEHVPLDLVLTEPGRFNLESLAGQTVEMRNFLLNEFHNEVLEDAHWNVQNTHVITLRVLRLLKNKIAVVNDKIRVIATEREKYMNQVATVTEFIYDTLPLRANAIDPEGLMEAASVAIAVIQQLVTDLTSMQEQLNEPRCNLKRHEDDPMQPHARRERTSNELHTLLINMLLSGVDVALKDLDEYLSRHVSSIDALIRTSMQLEGFTKECCIGCEEHGVKNEDPKYDRPDGKKCHYCLQYGIGRCKRHAPQAQGRR